MVGQSCISVLPNSLSCVLMWYSVATLRSTDGVDVYFEMPGDDSEHANFLCAKMDLEERRMKRINEVSQRLDL